MKQFKFVILLLLIGMEGDAQLSHSVKLKEKLINGKEFQHPRSSRYCLSEKNCLAVSSSYCKSGYSVPVSCFEQYSGVWITRCRCQKKDKKD